MESAYREDIFACDICSKSFNTKTDFKRHGHIHEELNRFPCLLCQKTFTQAGSLKTHKLVHTGE